MSAKSDEQPEWFKQWQHKFYRSKAWNELRQRFMMQQGMRSSYSGKLITGRYVVHHKIAITPDNYQDESITLNIDNLQLLTLNEHTTVTFSDLPIYSKEQASSMDRNVNLF
jgi:hypothetical protein